MSSNVWNNFLHFALPFLFQSKDRPFQETHLRVCIQWRRRMLHLAYRSYGQALRMERRRTVSPDGAQHSSTVMNETSTTPSPSSTSTSVTTASPFSSSIGSSPAGTQVDEEWLYHYMLTKCEEKAGPGGLFREAKKKKLHEQGTVVTVLLAADLLFVSPFLIGFKWLSLELPWSLILCFVFFPFPLFRVSNLQILMLSSHFTND